MQTNVQNSSLLGFSIYRKNTFTPTSRPWQGSPSAETSPHTRKKPEINNKWEEQDRCHSPIVFMVSKMPMLSQVSHSHHYQKACSEKQEIVQLAFQSRILPAFCAGDGVPWNLLGGTCGLVMRHPVPQLYCKLHWTIKLYKAERKYSTVITGKLLYIKQNFLISGIQELNFLSCAYKISLKCILYSSQKKSYCVFHFDILPEKVLI